MSALEGMCLILAMLLATAALPLSDLHRRASTICVVGALVFTAIAIGSLVWRTSL